MSQLPLDTSVEAVYEDGYILSETALHDISPYNPIHNVLRAIIDKEPEAEHGKLVEFAVYYKNQRFAVDWTTLPDNARPIRFRDGFMTLDNAGNEESGWSGCRFGYQYNDENGKNIQEVVEL
jgi:hypothetical protein